MLFLCREYKLLFVLGTPLGVTECGLWHVFPHVFLPVVACRWWKDELWLVAAKFILGLLSKDVERG